ncbi:MAG: CDP-alcohol phosphatidyltransferase family protein [Caldimicrobium sp.]
MNLTGKKETLKKFYLPFAYVFCKTKTPPNIITLLSLLAGTTSALAYYYNNLLTGLTFLMISGLLDLIDGTVARSLDRPTKFGAVFDWISDKWVDGLVLGVVGFIYAGPSWAILVVTLSMLHSFIKPVVYAEIGFEDKVNGKIIDPLEHVGFFGRPETHLTLLFFTLTEKANFELGLSFGIKLITLLTALSLLHRLFYLYKHFGKVEDE